MARRAAGRGWILAAVVALAVAAFLVWRQTRADEQPAVAELEEAIAEADAVPALPAEGAWRTLPPLPLPARDQQADVWTGSELIVWGGALDDGFGRRTFHADGAALDPASGAWRQLPAAPLEPRTNHAAVWTGSQLIVWGGTGRTGLLADGASYDPATDRWRALPAAPLSPRADAAVLWTGSQVLVVGGADNSGPLVDAASYDPESSTWERLADLPAEFAAGDADIGAVWAGDQAVAWKTLGLAGAVRFDPVAGAWSALPDPVGGAAGLPALVAADGRLHGLRVSNDATSAELVTLEPGAPEWTVTPAPAPRGDPWNSTALWTGSALLFAAADGSGATAYQPETGTWSLIPEAPAAASGTRSIAWTGQELLLVAGQPTSDPDAATGSAAWTPPP